MTDTQRLLIKIQDTQARIQIGNISPEGIAALLHEIEQTLQQKKKPKRKK